MKESIDLTERRDFREVNTTKSVKYPHKKLPWGYTDKNGLTERYNKERNSLYTTFDGSSTWISHDSEGDFILNNNLFIDYNTYNFDLSFNTSNLTYKFKYDYPFDDLNKGDIFPTGKRDYIMSHRKIDISESKYIKKLKLCVRCKQKISIVPWVESSIVCKNCYEKDSKRHDDTRIRWIPKHVRDMSFSDDYFKVIPCLSKRIKMEKLEREIPKRYIVWDKKSTEKFIRDFFSNKEENKTIKEKSVYFKGRTVQRREELWQPKGRIIQEYDNMFDNTDWRDLLKKRVGILERESILSKEVKWSFTLNTTNINTFTLDTNNIISWFPQEVIW